MTALVPTHVQQTRENWPPGAFRDGLELIAEGVTEMVGFNLACLSVVRPTPDGTSELEVIALAGHDYGNEVVIGRRTPLSGVLKELEKAEDWGLFSFLPHELLDTEDVANAYGWVVPDLIPLDRPDAWHPLDLLVALLYDAQGTLRGSLSIDMPENGLRPDPEQRRLLEKFAVQAERAVVTHLEREELAEQVRLADTARTIVRNASAQQQLGDVLEQCQKGLVDGFRCRGSWIQTYDEDGRGSGAIYSSTGTEIALPRELVGIAERAARTCWARRTTAVVSADHPVGEALSEAEHRTVLGFLDSIGVSSMLFVPLGAGAECLGNLVLTRTGDREWTELDRGGALDIGHDLGRVILNSRIFQREHELVVELRDLDSYKSQLIATVSHELKNPLTAITGYAEMLDASADLSPSSRTAVEAINRGAGRLSRVVEDLLLLSSVEDPNRPIDCAPVDLTALVEESLDLMSVTIGHSGLTVRVDAPDGPVVAAGDADELERVVTNLLSNAVKYTVEGEVAVALRRHGGQVSFAVSDQGLGISEADQEQLFTEFFRSTNAAAVSRPGTGLGLAIVKQVVERHGGAVEVDSELGRGSTFAVTLPAAG